MSTTEERLDRIEETQKFNMKAFREVVDHLRSIEIGRGGFCLHKVDEWCIICLSDKIDEYLSGMIEALLETIE